MKNENTVAPHKVEVMIHAWPSSLSRPEEKIEQEEQETSEPKSNRYRQWTKKTKKHKPSGLLPE
jgi:hypothetical protein